MIPLSRPGPDGPIPPPVPPPGLSLGQHAGGQRAGLLPPAAPLPLVLSAAMAAPLPPALSLSTPLPGALLFRPGPALAPEAHRVARALLESAARDRGGQVSESDGAWRLVAAPRALEMARHTLSAVLNGRDAALVTEALPPPAAPEPRRTGPEAAVAARPLETLLERRAILGFGPGGAPRPAGLRVRPDPAAVAAATGPRWAGAPWQTHAEEAVARRAAALAGPSAPPEEGVLHLDLPPEALGLVAGAPVLPVIPARALAQPPAAPFAVALPAALLPLLRPGHVPGAAIHLARDPALDALPPDFWAALNPARVVLEGVDDAGALAWGLARGIARFSGAWADRLLAAAGRRA